jgi:nitroreductase
LEVIGRLQKNGMSIVDDYVVLSDDKLERKGGMPPFGGAATTGQEAEFVFLTNAARHLKSMKAAVGDFAVRFVPGPTQHLLSAVSGGDVRKLLARAALSQKWVAHAPICLVITAEYGRIIGKYGKRGVRYAMIEAGHIGQNVFLQAEALGLKAGIVGAFDDKGVNRTLNIPLSHEPLLVMPIGYRR